MEVKNPQAAILCDYEVLSLLNEMRHSGTAVNQETSQLATIIYETSHHLLELPCNQQNPEKIDRILTLLKDFPIPLTKLEKTMLCNMPPESPLQLSLIIKDCDEKLTEADIELWLTKISEALS